MSRLPLTGRGEELRKANQLALYQADMKIAQLEEEIEERQRKIRQEHQTRDMHLREIGRIEATYAEKSMSEQEKIEWDDFAKGLIADLEGGCEVWGYKEAALIRKINRVHPDVIEIIPNHEALKRLGLKYDGASQMPYFNAILKPEGRAVFTFIGVLGGHLD